MTSFILEQNKTTGKTTTVEFADDKARATVTQDVSDILEYAADMRQATQGDKYGDMKRIGVMPLAVIGQAMREGWMFDEKKIKQWFNDNPHFKTFDREFS